MGHAGVGRKPSFCQPESGALLATTNELLPGGWKSLGRPESGVLPTTVTGTPPGGRMNGVLLPKTIQRLVCCRRCILSNTTVPTGRPEQAQPPPPSSDERRPFAEQDGAGAADALQIQSLVGRYLQAASRILEQSVAHNRDLVAASRRSRCPSTSQRGIAVNFEQKSTMRERDFPSTLEKHRADGRDREAKRRQNMSPDSRLRYITDDLERSAVTR